MFRMVGRIPFWSNLLDSRISKALDDNTHILGGS